MKVFTAFITEYFKIIDFVSLTLTSVQAKENTFFWLSLEKEETLLTEVTAGARESEGELLHLFLLPR